MKSFIITMAAIHAIRILARLHIMATSKYPRTEEFRANDDAWFIVIYLAFATWALVVLLR